MQTFAHAVGGTRWSHRSNVAANVLAGVMDKFHYLKIGLGVVLAFVGVKMILAHTAWKIDTLVSLGVIVLILTTSVVWSLLKPKRAKLPDAAQKASLTPAA
jgi:tellurite resistance protein TerC